jgi:hypothetical protein
MQRSRATYDDLAISEGKINDTPQMPLNCLMTGPDGHVNCKRKDVYSALLGQPIEFW